LIDEGKLLSPFLRSGSFEILEPSSSMNKQLKLDIHELEVAEENYQHLVSNNNNWVNKLTVSELDQAIQIAAEKESSLLKVFSGEWRKVKAVVDQNYNFGNHQLAPTYLFVLQQLKQEYQLNFEVVRIKEKLLVTYNVDDIMEFNQSILLLERHFIAKELKVLSYSQPSETIRVLEELTPKFLPFKLELENLLAQASHKNLAVIHDDLLNLEANLSGLSEALPALRDFAEMPLSLIKFFQKEAINSKDLNALIAKNSLEDIFAQHIAYANSDFTILEDAVKKIRTAYKKLLTANAIVIKAKRKSIFQKNIALSTVSVSNLSIDDKKLKKNYSDGRKILEHEFSKSMRFKSIRELTTKESNLVLKDLKPVWLMSPLSISDSIPLDTSYFDVVIFDEASQITVEEGIPALYRATQTIIVGDDKQMPPTNFFNSKAQDPDDIDVDQSLEDAELLSSDADSLLVQGAKKLYSTMLCWHYRSNYETLISFSNHAFYNADLLTIPDKAIHTSEKQEINIAQKDDASASVTDLFDRSISYHYLQDSPYERRGNLGEASYIAELVRKLLIDKVEETIAIVAFSQEQQMIIEDALTELASADKVFEQLLEEANTRTEDGQFVGLIVKNLENIQGDERDIIIMSVCYGRDRNKRMLMNFGPINKKGGEKRLNVLFSRAKRHIAVVSSIKHNEITNEYNEGANYFKRFLHYAECVSTGNMTMARSILDGFVFNKSSFESTRFERKSIVVQQIKHALAKMNIIADEQIGHSIFRCSLAIKSNPKDVVYKLGVLIDDDFHYANDNVLEQYFQRPELLRAFGWNVFTVYSKDWLTQPEAVVDKILQRLHEEIIKEEEILIEATEDEIEEIITDVFEKTMIETPKKNTPIVVPNQNSDVLHQVIFEQYIFQDGASNKFWEVGINHTKLYVRFGKIGTKGQTQIKSFADNESAIKEKEKLVIEKKKKGYVKG
jgi:predicted DNA-binding WGR domain protein